MKPKMMKDARVKMLKKLKSKAKDDMYESPMKELSKGMKKVTVASDSDEGLEKGLDKAKEILEKKEGCSEDEYECGGTKKKDGGIKERIMKKRKEYNKR